MFSTFSATSAHSGALAGAAAITGLMLCSQALLGCSGPQKHTPNAVTANADRFVAIRHGAWLHSAPDDTHPRARNPYWASKKPPIDHASVYRLLHEGPEWLEISTASGDFKDHCMWRPWFAKRIQLKLYVRRKDAVQLTRRRLRTAYEDNTWVELAAGVPVRDRGKPGVRGTRLYIARARPFGVETFLHPNDVGIAYSPSGKYSNKATKRYLKHGTKLWFGFTGSVGRIKNTYIPELNVQQMSSGTKQPRVIVQHGCLKIRTRVAEQNIADRSLGSLFGGIGGSVMRSKPVATLPAGTQLFWPDGTPAGEVVTTLPIRGAINEGRELACFSVSLLSSSLSKKPSAAPANLPVCALDSAVPRGSK